MIVYNLLNHVIFLNHPLAFVFHLYIHYLLLVQKVLYVEQLQILQLVPDKFLLTSV